MWTNAADTNDSNTSKRNRTQNGQHSNTKTEKKQQQQNKMQILNRMLSREHKNQWSMLLFTLIAHSSILINGHFEAINCM